MYDTLSGELASTKDYRAFADNLTDYIQTDYTYNSAGLLTQVTYSDAALIDTNNTTGITEEYTYTYDGRGYIVGEKLDTDYSTTEAMETMFKAYEYDSVGRLVKAANGGTQETNWSSWDNYTQYEYDRVGNRTGMDDGTDEYTYDYTQFNQLEEVTKNSNAFESYTYDLRGNQTVKYTDYSGGSATQAEVYTYDLQNRLAEVGTTSDVVNLTNVTTINTNIYNAGGQRIKKTENSQLTKYFYSGDAILYTTDSNNTIMTENVLDLSGSIIASWRDRDTGSEEAYFYHYDVRGSTTAIVDPNGDAVKQYTYDEFGNMEETGTFDNEVTFTGSIKDTSTGLQYMNARFYEPTTGRFISQDSYTGNPYDPWTQHLYSYCGNNPTNFVDPTGHYWVDCNHPPYRTWVTYGGDGSREGRKAFYDKYDLTMTNDEDWRYDPNYFSTSSSSGGSSGSSSSSGGSSGSSSSSGGSSGGGRNSAKQNEFVPLGIEDSKQNEDWTIAVGTEFYAQCFARVSTTGQLFYSSDGTWGLLRTDGIGGGLAPSIGANIKVSYFGGPASSLEGNDSVSVGVGGGLGIVGGGEVIFSSDKKLIGGSITAGIGASLIPFDINCEWNFTDVTILGHASTPEQAQKEVLLRALDPHKIYLYPNEMQDAYWNATIDRGF